MEKCNLVKERVLEPYITVEGNVSYHANYFKYFLKSDDERVLSKEYYCMEPLGNDHYAVASLVDMSDVIDYDYYYSQSEKNEVKTVLKWAIMRVNRDNKGNVICGYESLVTPYLYDRITTNNLLTATVYNNYFLTYVDLDPTSENYGKQLVPCILEKAVPFNLTYEGFAECSLSGKTMRYLPRNCRIQDEIYTSSLLSEGDMQLLIRYFHGEEDVLDTVEGSYAKDIYRNLTGINLTKKNCMSLQKKYKEKYYE